MEDLKGLPSMLSEAFPKTLKVLYQFDVALPHPVTLSEAKGLSSSKPRCFAEHVLSGAEGLSMTCVMGTLNWYKKVGAF